MRILYLLISGTVILVLIRVNYKLYSQEHSFSDRREDIILQMNFLEKELKENDLGKRMQRLFPEGFVFANALYGLAWCELALSGEDESLRAKALEEALFAYDEIDSNLGKSTFDSRLDPKYGIFYLGWRNYLLSKIFQVDTNFEKHDQYRDVFEANCHAINEAISHSKTPFLQSYESLSWPADTFIAMASLANHDQVFKSLYANTIQEWTQDVENNLHSEGKILPHRVDYPDGKTLETPRGSSMSLMLRVLAEIDKEFANRQYQKFTENFVETTFGLPSIREYPKGEHGLGDVDSGPVIFGVGFSATLMSIGTLASFGDLNTSMSLYQTIHAFGFDQVSGSQKQYLFGQLPIADAFIAWGRATALKSNSPYLAESSENWRVRFHLISLAVLALICVIPLARRKLNKKHVSRRNIRR